MTQLPLPINLPPERDIYTRWRSDIKRKDWGAVHVRGDSGAFWGRVR
jgi:hypothetical protein